MNPVITCLLQQLGPTLGCRSPLPSILTAIAENGSQPNYTPLHAGDYIYQKALAETALLVCRAHARGIALFDWLAEQVPKGIQSA